MVMIKGADPKSVVHACMYGEYGMHFCCPRKKYDTRSMTRYMHKIYTQCTMH